MKLKGREARILKYRLQSIRHEAAQMLNDIALNNGDVNMDYLNDTIKEIKYQVGRIEGGNKNG